MYDVIHINIHDTGLYVSLPWILRTMIAYVFGLFIDWIIASKCVSVTVARKFALFLGKIAH